MPRELEVFFLSLSHKWKSTLQYALYLLDLFLWAKIRRNPLKTGKYLANSEYFLGALSTHQTLLAFYIHHILNSHNNLLKQLCSSFYWRARLKLSSLPRLSKVAGGQPRLPLMSIKPKHLFFLPRREVYVSKIWDLPLNFAWTNRKWIT